MLKSAALNARCLSTSLQKGSHIHSSSRLLHNSNDVSRPSRDEDAISPPTKKKGRAHPTPRQPKQSSATQAKNRGEWDDILGPSRGLELRHDGRRTELSESPTDTWNELTKDMARQLRQLKHAPTQDLSEPPTSAWYERRKEARKARLDRQPKFASKLGVERAIRPAVQSARVNELGESGQFEEAIAYLFDAPRDTLNTITWNSLLSMLMKAGKRKRAYEVYTEMKRRGFFPSTSTYITMLNGMSLITPEEWPSNNENLMRTHKIYEAFEAHVTLSETRGIKAELLYAAHARICYIRAVTRAGLFQRAIDLFYSAPETGTMARDKYLYAIMFNSLRYRTTTDKLGSLSLQEQNASDAKFLWRTLEKDVERGMEFGSYVIFPFLKLMVGGRPADQLFGLEVVRDYCGLAAPGETASPARVPLDSYTFQATLELCNKAQKYRLCSYFVKQLLDRQRVGTSYSGDLIIQPAHIHEFILALRHLATEGSLEESTRAVEAIRFLLRSAALESTKPANVGPKLLGDKKLRAYTVAHAFAICWRCRDWESATKLFSLVTRCEADDYLDDGPVAKDCKEPKSFPLMNVSSYAHMARTALLTETKGKMRQCLRMISIDHIKSDPYEVYSNFYLVTLSKVIIKLVSAASGGASEREKWRFQELMTKSREILSKPMHVDRPELEETLGSAKYIDKLEQAIDFELSARKSS